MIQFKVFKISDKTHCVLSIFTYQTKNEYSREIKRKNEHLRVFQNGA